MIQWALVVLLAADGAAPQRPTAPPSQTSSGRCSPNIANVQGNVTIHFNGAACVGIDPGAVRQLNEFLKQFPDAQKRLLELLDKKDQELRQAVAQAEDWSRKYRELSQLLEQQGADDDLSRQAATLLKAGELEKAGRLLDDILAREESHVDRAARAHYYRGRSLELEFKPQEALPHYENAYRFRPQSWPFAFAFARLLHEQNEYQKAETAYDAALEEVNKNRAAHLPDVAATLNNLGALYRETNRIAEATETLEDALGIGRWLAKASNGARFLPYLATTLDNLGSLYRDTKKTTEAGRSYAEALAIRRKLAQGNNRAAYLPDVATTLDNMGTLHRNAMRMGAAGARYREALAIRRELAQANRAAYLPHVAETLSNVGNVYTALRQTAAAERAYEEALEIRRELAKANRPAYLPHVAGTLHDLGLLYRNTKRLGEAERACAEALEIRRELAIANSAAYLPLVAGTLHDLGLLYRAAERLAESERAFAEAVTLRRTFWSTNPVTYGDGLANSLMELVRLRREQSDTSCAMLREALKVARSFEVRGQAASGVRALCPV